MPLACDPRKTFDVWLKSDANTPEETRPVFVFRYINNREFCSVADAMDSLSKYESGSDAVRECMDQIRVGLVGWRNMPDPDGEGLIDYNPDDLDRLLTHTETHELVSRMLTGAMPSGDDLGKSDARP